LGKRYSLANVGQRNPNDMYQTPKGITYEFYRMYSSFLKGNRILEPFAGKGAIVQALKEKNDKLDITGSDISDGVNSFNTGVNFFDIKEKYDVIVSNPPYKDTLKIIEHSLKIANNVFLLMPIAHLSGQERFEKDIYGSYLCSVDILSRMPMFSSELREDGKFETGMMVVGWYHFSKHKRRGEPPIILFMDVQKWVVNKKDKKC